MNAPENRDPLTELTATAAVRAIRSGEVRAVSYASALLEAANDGAALNAFMTLEPDAVLDVRGTRFIVVVKK